MNYNVLVVRDCSTQLSRDVSVTERKYSMLLNDVGSRHAASDRLHLSSLSADVHTRDLVGRSLAHSAAPSPVSSVFETVQRPSAVVNYSFGQLQTPLLLVTLFDYLFIHHKTANNSRQRLRSSATHNLIVAHTQCRTVGDRAFSVAAARVWNNLPLAVHSATSLNTFKNHLNTHLFQSSYSRRGDVCHSRHTWVKSVGGIFSSILTGAVELMC